MNATVDGVEPPHTNNNGKLHGGDAYIFIIGFFCITVLLLSLTYASYVCKRSRLPPPPTISFGTITSDDPHNHHLISLSHGLDDNVLVTFPTFLYSDVKMTHKGGTATDSSGASGCSICLADYKPADVVRLLPECGHLFHVKCVDTWLKAHPTCPMCRNSVFAGRMPPGNN
ncbi:hypothetical protein LXL04_012798 [Taraxacum kok-saghyz]